ncbi:MAG: hypothetical protein JXJ20_05630 [Anaerolineae bacterium]|nr:hypothetical protein [Anaerolineae bacterium]
MNRNRKISHILFFVSLGGMGLGFFYTWSSPTSSSQFSCMILPILLLMTIASVRMANLWIREPRPEDVLNEALKGFGSKYTIFHYLLPAQHVLIGPEGIFTISTVWQERSYRVSGKKWYGDGGITHLLFGYLRQDLLGNPFRDALVETREMQGLVNKIVPNSDIEVQPLVVFINPKASVEIEDPLLPVLYADPRKKPSLKGYLRDQQNAGRETLTVEQMDEIDRKYGLITRQELEAMSYAGDEDEYEYDEADAVEAEPAELSEEAAAGEGGLVYIFQSGQLYKIGAAWESIDEPLAEAQADARLPVEVLHTIPTGDPEKFVARLERKFARKKQKDWYGLSKKDVAWLLSLGGDTGADDSQA